MRREIKLVLMLMGAAGVLLAAGGFPLMGAPAVYRSGAMLLLGLLAAVLCAVGGWRLAGGERLRLAGGLVCVFFACAGVAVVWHFGNMAVEMAGMGGPMWFGAIGMACTGLVGLIFTGLFGYMTRRLMHRRLWLAGAHWALVLVAVGAYTDYCNELRVPVNLAVGAQAGISSVPTPHGAQLPLDFTLTIEDFHVFHYDTRSYTLHRYDKGRWQAVAKVPENDGQLMLPGGTPINAAELHTAPGMPRPFLLLPGTPAELIMQDAPPVREYKASCRIDTHHRGRPETRRTALRVNEPISCKGWMVYLMNYRNTASGTEVELLLRRAPGRLPALAGMVGIILCSAFWCWSGTIQRKL